MFKEEVTQYCPMCQEWAEKYKAKEQECEILKKEVQQTLKKNAENYSNSCLLQKEVNQLKEQIKRLQEDLKIRCDMYFKESYKNYKLSEISCEWNARSCIEKLEKFLMSDDLLIEKISNASNEIKRFFKECTPNKDKRLADFIPEDEYTKCLKAQQQLDQLKAENDELKKIIARLDVPKHEVIDMDIALENEKLKQTLTEIKEIAKDNVCYLDCDYRWILEKILQKISECEVENEKI